MTDLSSRWIFPKEIHLENFTYALEKGGLITAMYNSIIITVIREKNKVTFVSSPFLLVITQYTLLPSLFGGKKGC